MGETGWVRGIGRMRSWGDVKMGWGGVCNYMLMHGILRDRLMERNNAQSYAMGRCMCMLWCTGYEGGG